MYHAGKILCLILFVSAMDAAAQNLVPNSGFEDYRGDQVKYWTQPGSPYYHFETGSKNTHSGKGRNGLCLWVSEPSEFMTVKLSGPLWKGAAYQVIAHVLFDPTKQMIVPLKRIKAGFLFTPQPVDASYKQVIYEMPQVNFNLENNTGWTRYASEFIAAGGEEYLTIGHFHNMENDSASYDLKNTGSVINEKAVMDSVDTLQKMKDAEIKDATTKFLDSHPALVKFYDIINIQNKRKREKEYKKLYENTRPLINKLNREISYIRDKYDNLIRDIYIQNNPVQQVRFSDDKNFGRYYFDDIAVTETYRPPPDLAAESTGSVPGNRDENTETVNDTIGNQFLNSEEGDVIVLNNVYFETDKSELLPGSFEELDLLVYLLETRQEIEIEISGHTDNTGSAEKNRKLSLARAKSVTTYIVTRGISMKRVKYTGHGSSLPVASNTTDEGKAKNRRVECKILKKQN